MPSQKQVRRSALIGVVAILVVFLSAPTASAQNSSWDQAIAALKALVDQQSAMIAQLQSALASETAARQSATTTLQSSITTASSTQNAALSAESTARQAGEDSMQGGLRGEAAARQAHVDAADRIGDRKVLLRHLTGPAAVLHAFRRVVERRPVHRHAADVSRRRKLRRRKLLGDRLAYADSVVGSEAGLRQQGDADMLAAAKQYADSVVGSEAGARQAMDNTLQSNIAGEASVRQQGDINTLTAANAYADAEFSDEAAARLAADTILQTNIDAIQSGGGGGGGGNTGTIPQQLLDLAPYLSVDMNTINGLPGPHVILTGVNLHIRNGQPLQNGSWPTFDTKSYNANGRGNLIVGYNDDGWQAGITDARSGSHNIVIGDLHRFTASGGFLSGWMNASDANAVAVSGYSNGASGWGATVGGGQFNYAIGPVSHVSGGVNNLATGEGSSVTGGLSNEAAGNYSTISGGYTNYANGFESSVSGGQYSWAKGDASSVSGGDHNTAEGVASSVAGGQNLTATGDYSTLP